MNLISTSDKANYQEQMEIKTEMVLFRMGIAPHLKGFNYICQATMLLIEDPDRIYGVTKTIYPEIARRESKQSSEVERSIRHAIESAWNKEGKNSLRYYFSHYSRKPTNRTFLAFLYKYVTIDTSTSDFLHLM